MQIKFKDGGACKAYGVFPDIVLADKLVHLAAVDNRERPLREVAARAGFVRGFAVEPSGALCRVHDAERVKLCGLVGKGRCDRNAPVAQLVGKVIAEIVVPSICIFKIIGQGKAAAGL